MSPSTFPSSAAFSPATGFCRSSGCYMLETCQSTTRRSKVQPFLDLLIPLFQQCLTPGRQISIDEAMITFRGRIFFRQYIRGKPEPWGIEAYESQTGYMYNLFIYYGRETQLTSTEHNHTTNVVLTLVNPLVGLGYDLYTDRFYASPALASELLKLNPL